MTGSCIMLASRVEAPSTQPYSLTLVAVSTKISTLAALAFPGPNLEMMGHRTSNFPLKPSP